MECQRQDFVLRGQLRAKPLQNTPQNIPTGRINQTINIAQALANHSHNAACWSPKMADTGTPSSFGTPVESALRMA